MKRLMLVLVVFLMVAGCAMSGTSKPGNVDKYANAKLQQEIRRQQLGLKRNETDCYTIYSALADECGYDMSRRCRSIRRARDRIGKIQRCETTWNRDSIKAIMRDAGRR